MFASVKSLTSGPIRAIAVTGDFHDRTVATGNVRKLIYRKFIHVSLLFEGGAHPLMQVRCDDLDPRSRAFVGLVIEVTLRQITAQS